MDVTSILALGRLVIELVKLGVSLPSELTLLAKRVDNGEFISDEELKASLERVKAAQDTWNNT